VTVATPPRPSGPDELEALIEEAWQHARRRRRRIRIALLLAGSVALAGAIAIGTADSGGSVSPGVRRSGAATDRSRQPAVRYWYTRTTVPAGVPVMGIAVPSGRAIIETWIGTDGTWRQRVSEPATPGASSDAIIGGDGLFPPQANATGSNNGVPFNARDPGDGLFTYRQLQSLPTTVPALRSRIQRAVAAQTERDLNAYVLPGKRHRQIVARLRPRYFGGPAGQPGQALIAISDLETSPLPPRLRAALFAVAQSLPGVRSVAGERDALGRSGIGLSAGGELPLIFDPRTATLLAGVSGTVVAHGAVNAITVIPKHLAAISEPAGLTAPQLAIRPRSGSPSATFTIELTAPTTPAQPDRAPALFANLFGPTGPGCVYWMSRPSFARIPPGTATTTAGSITYTYQLSPAAIGRMAWCPGRYQLLIAPISQSQPPASANEIQHQLVHAAAYFTIR
jgi:hypothetical protein